MKNVSFLLCIALLVCCVFAKSKYSYNGEGNNPHNPRWGKSGEPLIRRVPVVYQDGIKTPVGGLENSALPSTRHISNLLFGREVVRHSNPRMVTDILTFWGQFLDHDLDFSPDSNCEKFFIPIPEGDPIYDALSQGGKTMKFCRTTPHPDSGTSKSNPRAQPNVITAWIDGSAVYGHTEARATALRTFSGGLLKTEQGPDGELMPKNLKTEQEALLAMANPARRTTIGDLFACGDPRCNENPILAAIHTLFVREHNRRARALPKTMSDEDKFQEARRFVIGHIQAITFNEYIPALMGVKLPAYKGYNSSINPQISSFFSTVAFRYGHDEVNSVIQRLKPDGTPISEGPILLRDSYFWPLAVRSVGIGPYLRGASVNPQHSVDGMLADDLRNFLFGQVPGIATDLAARNLQRGRDHGIARYNQCRQAFNLPTIKKFEDLTDDPNVVKLLNKAYGRDNVGNLDPYIGALLERKRKNSNLGDLFTVSISEQLLKVRDGDRFWYENAGVFTSGEKNELDSTTLADIISRNTDSKLPKHIFTRTGESPGVVFAAGGKSNNNKWIAAIIIMGIVAIALVVLVVVLFIKQKKVGQENKQLYTNLLEEDK